MARSRKSVTEGRSSSVLPRVRASADLPLPPFAAGPFEGLHPHHYQLIMADPAWRFETRSSKGLARAPQMHYPCMSLDDIKRLPVGDLAAKDATLLLWAIDPMLPQALEVMAAWGFRFSTVGFVWAKLNKRANLKKFTEADFFTGLGYWTRANAELCLLGVKGRPKRLSKSIRRLIVSPRREHSRKPEEAYARAAALCPGPRLELFSRTERRDWTSWGNEKGLFRDPELQLDLHHGDALPELPAPLHQDDLFAA
jgi:N6-adenosine-specific RNA methylase IME4